MQANHDGTAAWLIALTAWLALGCAAGDSAVSSSAGSLDDADDDGSFVDPLETDGAGAGESSSGWADSGDPFEVELCNGLDDDGDGVIDDGLGELECGTGECASAAPACLDGVPGFCVPGPPVPESCNGLDDDCDGASDEDGVCSEPAGEPGFGDCMNDSFEGACLPSETCSYVPAVPDRAVCTMGCASEDDCPAAPTGGNAVVQCREDDFSGVQSCAIVCEGGLTCPDGMTCADGSTCAWAIDPTSVGYGDCLNEPWDTACLATELCIVDMRTDSTRGVCSKKGCDTAAECFAAPGGSAPVTCADVTADGSADCYLDCSAGTCPDGMVCLLDYVCVWPA